MRKSRVIVTVLALSIIGMLGVCYYKDIVHPNLQTPIFSKETGFYPDAFELEMVTNRHANIYYTLDGSVPTAASILYEKPIMLTDPTENPNLYSDRTDLSAAFFAEEDRFSVPVDPVDKAVVIRAIAITEDGKEMSDIETATYFVGPHADCYAGCDMISLVTDPDNLFGYKNGIYVSGETFDEFVSSGERDAMSDPDHWRRWKANYTNSGMEWERPVHLDYFDADGNRIFSDEAGIRIKGGTSRAFTQKSFRLYARKEYSGRDAFKVPFFGEYGKSKIVLFSGAQDYRTKMQDALVAYATQGMQFEVMQNRPCRVFLDGEYWGMYYLMEEICEEYLTEHYNLPRKDAVILKNGDPKSEGKKTEKCFAEWEEIEKDETPFDDASYASLCNQIDMDSYIDYYAAEIYIARCQGDWPKYNEAQWRSADNLGIEKCDGKWRWMLFDTNWSCLSMPDDDTIAYTMEQSKLFNRLMHYKPFRDAFLARLSKLGTNEFDPIRLAPEFERLRSLMEEPVKKDLKKYYGNNKGDDAFEKEVKCIAEFLQERPRYIEELIHEKETEME